MDFSPADAVGTAVGTCVEVEHLVERLTAVAVPASTPGYVVQRHVLTEIATCGFVPVFVFLYDHHGLHVSELGAYMREAVNADLFLKSSYAACGNKLARVLGPLQAAGWIKIHYHSHGHPEFVSLDVPNLLTLLPLLRPTPAQGQPGGKQQQPKEDAGDKRTKRVKREAAPAGEPPQQLALKQQRPTHGNGAAKLPGPDGASPPQVPVSPPTAAAAVASQLPGFAISEPSGITIRVAQGSLFGVNTTTPKLNQVISGLEYNLKRQLAGEAGMVVACQCRDHSGLFIKFTARISPCVACVACFDRHWCSCRRQPADQVPTICAGLPSAARPVSPEWRRIHPASS